MSAPQSKKITAFTLVELLVVIGIIALLIGILMPALSRARRQANQTACLANLRSMNQALAIYFAQDKGHLPYYNWHPGNAEQAWHGYWIGVLGDLRCMPDKIICPEAREPLDFKLNGSSGLGSVNAAWSGELQSTATGVKYDSQGFLNTTMAPGGYRIGSYGFNRNITVDSKKFGKNVANIRHSTDVPVFYDSVWVDNIDMYNGSPSDKPPVPTSLSGADAATAQANKDKHKDQFRIWIARHGRGINIAFVDGSARYVGLEETYNLYWTPTWNRYVLPKGWLPPK